MSLVPLLALLAFVVLCVVVRKTVTPKRNIAAGSTDTTRKVVEVAQPKDRLIGMVSFNSVKLLRPYSKYPASDAAFLAERIFFLSGLFSSAFKILTRAKSHPSR
jgi:hypothetical protein